MACVPRHHGTVHSALVMIRENPGGKVAVRLVKTLTEQSPGHIVRLPPFNIPGFHMDNPG